MYIRTASQTIDPEEILKPLWKVVGATRLLGGRGQARDVSLVSGQG